MSERRSGWSKGCLIAVAISGGLVLVCGGFLTWAGYAVWTNPEVQRGVAITSAAMDMTQEAMLAPGANELRAAGCTQAMALTTDTMMRFYESAAIEAPTPRTPLLVCIVARSTTPPSCEAVVQAYAGALEEAPAEMAARVTVQGIPEPRCQGVYGPDGAFVGEMDPTMVRTFGQIGNTPSLGQ